ncbi:exosortase F system-associated protein [Antarcticibacterium flavum]|uniref:Exosortase F system-associated protein n=1 Tax=Antarcticibacterium flavum TaxID=2058175 RepID=A0A5B7X0Z5_9FLAO|nr:MULTISPECIES: exosortase F system-associated protein [Antarcticibacterium]MCM4161015.1 exosortase F system-associated protein [Antarcticibacterium sp. W02-3]QCY69264.1 exosortase F system-associated protein [Antarcticibacterium flavum]
MTVKTRYRVAGISLLVGLLVLIRYFEHKLFYDPLIHFFYSDYLNGGVPNFETTRLLLNVVFRYFLNSLISLGIIYIAFFDRNILKFSVLLYSLLFFLCFPVFMFLVFTIENENFLALFYVRRFLIHPVFIIILLPAFYYYRLLERRKKQL